MLHWILIFQPVNNGGKSKFYSAECQKKLFNVEIEYLLGNSKIRQCRNYFTVICTLLEPKLSTSSSNVNKNEQKFPENCFQFYRQKSDGIEMELVCPPEFANVPLKFR